MSLVVNHRLDCNAGSRRLDSPERPDSQDSPEFWAGQIQCPADSSRKRMTLQVCDVCRLVDGDYTMKACEWCRSCQAWICEKDLDNWPRRSLAMARRFFGK